MNTHSVSFAQIINTFLASNVKVLSLDCFDTLFWRNTSRPFDIFTQLQHGLCPVARTVAEADARNKKYIETGLKEASLADIYAELEGQFDAEQQQQMIEHELTLEIDHGFLFSPALTLLRQAKARGIRTIIVSDTYFSADQLGRLLAAHCKEMPALIDHIYCSAEWGQGKSGSLWPIILEQERVRPEEIFHAGDNYHADYQQPVKLGITALHFRQNEALIANTLEQRVVAAKLLYPACGATAPVPSLFHACYSIGLRNEISGEQLTAWTVLGPILYAFARFIKQQRDNLSGVVKVGFLLRDGYMPREAYQTLYPDEESAALSISRLTSIRSSFHSRQSIIDYLSKTLRNAERITPSAFAMIASHMMLSAAQRKKIESRPEKHHYATRYLYRLLLAHDVVKETLARSAACRQRLITHLRQSMQPEPGDTLMLVDLGYSGTTQNLLGPLLEKELDVKVRGCYLIAAWTPGWNSNRTGLINPSTADYRLIRTLTRFIASFEMLCSSHSPSTIDYREDGEPISEGPDPSETMLSSIRALQQEALRCVRLAAAQAVPASAALWHSAAIDLARYIYFPQAAETDLLARLTFDINMGTSATKKLVNIREGINYMRRYGIARLTQDESDEMRTNTPSELQGCGIEYSASFLASSRYALSWSLSNSSQRQQPLEVLFIRNEASPQHQQLFATSTFDGYFSLYIPLVTPELVIMMGKFLRAFEIYSVSIIPQSVYCKSIEDKYSSPLELNKDYFIDGATLVNNLVIEMQDEGFIYFKPQIFQSQHILHFIYRPLNEKHQTDTAVETEK